MSGFVKVDTLWQYLHSSSWLRCNLSASVLGATSQLLPLIRDGWGAALHWLPCILAAKKVQLYLLGWIFAYWVSKGYNCTFLSVLDELLRHPDSCKGQM